MCSSRSPKNNTHGFFSCRVHPFSHRCARQTPPFVAARHLPSAGGSQPSRGRQPSQSRLAACQLPRWGSFFAVAASVLALSVCSRWSHPPLPKGEALAVYTKLMVLPRALPLGELLSKARLRGRGCCPHRTAFCANKPKPNRPKNRQNSRFVQKKIGLF